MDMRVPSLRKVIREVAQCSGKKRTSRYAVLEGDSGSWGMFAQHRGVVSRTEIDRRANR